MIPGTGPGRRTAPGRLTFRSFMTQARLLAAVLEGWAWIGALLLAAATVPQAVRFARGGGVDDFGWPFVMLNAAGLGLLLLRAVEIREWAFAGVNGATFAFWAFVGALKARGGRA